MVIYPMKYTIPTQFLFNGHFTVEAESQKEAEEMVEKHCALSLGTIYSTLSEEKVDWEFPVHPKKEIESLREKNPKVKVGDLVKVLKIHPASDLDEVERYVGMTGKVRSYYGCRENRDLYCCADEILIDGCHIYVVEWVLE